MMMEHPTSYGQGSEGASGPYLPTSLEPRLQSRRRSSSRPSTRDTTSSAGERTNTPSVQGGSQEGGGGRDSSSGHAIASDAADGHDQDAAAEPRPSPPQADQQDETPAAEGLPAAAESDTAPPAPQPDEEAGAMADGPSTEEPSSMDKGKGRSSDASPSESADTSVERDNESATAAAGSAAKSAPPVPPKSPRHQYTLPIGGGPPKPTYSLPIGRKSSSSPSIAMAGSSRSTSRMSRHGGGGGGAVAFLEPAISLRRNDSIQSAVSSATARPSSQQSEVGAHSSLDKWRRNSVESGSPALSSSQVGLERRRTLSASHIGRDKASADGLPLRKRASTGVSRGASVGQSRKLQQTSSLPGRKKVLRPQTAPPQDRDMIDPRATRRRRPTTSSIMMVEGQVFEINDGDETQDGDGQAGLVSRWSKDTGYPRPDTVESAYDESLLFSAVDDGERRSVGDEPMIYTEEEIDDVPPPGAYAIHPPSRARLTRASELPLYDEMGNIVDFGSVFSTRRTLICFLRHWLCPFCQMFSQSLQAVDPLPLERAELDLVVVGQGHWHVTKSYKEVMKIPKFVRMYSDPSRKIYKALGMTLRTNDAGPACSRPDYQTMGVFKASMVAMKKGIFDMPLRPPGDLMLLGGEFILGPGLQCTFTHRMVTTRGHLDLPRILVQAGCDLSLKTPPDMLQEQNQSRRPASTRSADHITARKLTRRLARRARLPLAVSGKNPKDSKASEEGTSTVKALNGQHESQQTRTLPRSFARKKVPPMPDVRHLNISYSMQQKSFDMSVDAVHNVQGRRSESGADGMDRTLATMERPPVSAFTKSISTGDMKAHFTRPARSPHRPPVPHTSSAAAYAAAQARAMSFSQPQSPVQNSLNPADPRWLLSSESVPTLAHFNHSSSTIHTVQQPSRHQRTPTASTATTATGTSSRPDTADSSYSRESNRSSVSLSKEVPITLPFHSQSNGLKHTGSQKRMGSQTGVPLSLFEKRIIGSASTTSLPQGGQAGAADGPLANMVAQTNGDESEYRRLDQHVLKMPTHMPSDQDEDASQVQDVPSNVSEHDVDELRSDWDATSLRPISHVLGGGEEPIERQDEEQKTPVARKISLDVVDMDLDGYGRGRDTPSQDVAPSAAPLHRSSILAATPAPYTQPSYGAGQVSAASGVPFTGNALFANLPQLTTSTRAPVPAFTPVFAAILAEEAARSRSHSRGTSRDEGDGSKTSSRTTSIDGFSTPAALSPRRSPKKAGGLMLSSGGGSFLDELDVHEGFRSRHYSSDAALVSPRSSRADETDYDDYGDEDGEYDDWAPLRASNNTIPASMSNEEDQSTVADDESQAGSSEQSQDEGGDDDDDDEVDYDGKMTSGLRLSPSQVRRNYELKHVTSRPSTAPVAASARTIQLNQGQRLYKQTSLTGLHAHSRRLSAFLEEEEEEEEEQAGESGDSREAGQQTADTVV